MSSGFCCCNLSPYYKPHLLDGFIVFYFNEHSLILRNCNYGKHSNVYSYYQQLLSFCMQNSYVKKLLETCTFLLLDFMILLNCDYV
jgi:hypothetical protein